MRRISALASVLVAAAAAAVLLVFAGGGGVSAANLQIRGQLLDADGDPLSNVQMLVQGYEGRPTIIDILGTDGDGEFAIPVPHGGAYRLSTDTPINGCHAYYRSDGATNDPSAAEWIQIAAADVSVLMQIPAGFCRKISGSLLNAKGQPLVGVGMIASGDGGEISGTTNRNGNFRFELPRSGDYQLHAVINDCKAYYRSGGATEDSEAAELIRVAGADVSGLRMQIPVGSCELDIRGLLLDAEGEPLPDVKMTAVGDADGREVSAVSGADGAFVIVVSRSGDYRLRAKVNGCNAYHRSGGAAANKNEAELIRVADADVSGLRMQIPADWCRLIGGRLLDADGGPLAGERVVASAGAEDGKDVGVTVFAVTGADGSFALGVPRSGDYQLQTTIGACTAYYRAGEAATTEWSEVELVRVDGANVSDLRLQLPANFCRLPIQGRLVDAAGAPLADVEIVAAGGAARPAGDSGRTAADGAFALTVALSGDYRLHAVINDCKAYYRAAGATADEGGLELIPVAAAGVSGLRMQIPAGICEQQISGSLTDAAGDPLSGIQVDLENSGNSNRITGWTDADGSFAVTVPGRGAYRLRASVTDCWPYYHRSGPKESWSEAELIQVAGADVSVRMQIPADFCLPEGPQIRGKLLAADGLPLADVRVSLSGAGRSTATTAADGAFTFYALGGGDYRLQADVNDCWAYYHRNGATESRSGAELIRVDKADVSGLRMQLPADLCLWQVQGLLLDVDRQPVPDVRMVAVRAADGRTMSAVSGSDGRFLFTDQRGGGYRIHAVIDGCTHAYYRSGSATTDRGKAELVRAGAVDWISLRMQIPSRLWCRTIRGVLLDADGDPLSNVQMHATADYDFWLGAQGRTDKRGKFEISIPAWRGFHTFRLHTSVRGCDAYYRSGGATTDKEAAELIRLAGVPVSVRMQIPAGFCREIRGTLLDADGGPLSGVRMTASGDEGEIQAVTDRRGKFELTVPRGGDYQLRASEVNGCTAYYRSDGAAEDKAAAESIHVADANVSVRMRIPVGFCELDIRGLLLSAGGEPLSDVKMFAVGDADGREVSVVSGADGAFVIVVSRSGDYRLRAKVNGCDAYYRSDGATGDPSAVELIHVAGADVSVQMQIPAGYCELDIRGLLLDAEGEPLPDVKMTAVGDADGREVSAVSGADGAFVIVVSHSGDYRLRAKVNGCDAYYRWSGGATANPDAAGLIHVAAADVSVQMQIPADLCSE